MSRSSPPVRKDAISVGEDTDVALALLNTLRHLRIELSTNTRQVAAVTGLKEPDLDVLDVLTREGVHSPTGLAKRLTIHVATMTGVLARWEKSRWIVRRRDVVDRRSVQVESTGFERLAELYRYANEQLDDIAAGLTADEAEVVLRYLRDVCDVTHQASMRIAGGQPTG
jgi:DNA-binding MarR family transcriptional regulator